MPHLHIHSKQSLYRHKFLCNTKFHLAQVLSSITTVPSTQRRPFSHSINRTLTNESNYVAFNMQVTDLKLAKNVL